MPGALLVGGGKGAVRADQILGAGSGAMPGVAAMEMMGGASEQSKTIFFHWC
jgi:hypothetical protein